jgi:hypothetical protein
VSDQAAAAAALAAAAIAALVIDTAGDRTELDGALRDNREIIAWIRTIDAGLWQQLKALTESRRAALSARAA